MLGYYQHTGEAIIVRLGVRVTVALEYFCSASIFTEFDTLYPLRIITQMPLPNSLLSSLLKCRYSESNHMPFSFKLLKMTPPLRKDRIRTVEFLFSVPKNKNLHAR